MTFFRNKLSACIQTICAAFFSILGFKAAAEVYVMYGMPVGDFEIKGSVTDAENAPVRNAQVKAKYDNEANQTVIEIARTDSSGNYTLSGKAVAERLQIICTPVENPSLRPDTVIVNLRYQRPDSLRSGGADGGKKSLDPQNLQRRGYRGSAKANASFKLKNY